MLLNCGVGEDSWGSFGLQGDQTGQSWRKSVLNIHWKDWCWSWNSNTLATWCEELTHWKRLRCWERVKAGREGDDRGWEVWMASPALWTWVWVSSHHPVMDREAYCAAVHGVTKSQTWPNNRTELTEGPRGCHCPSSSIYSPWSVNFLFFQLLDNPIKIQLIFFKN